MSSTYQQTLLDHHLAVANAPDGGERALLPVLLRWLVATGRLRQQTSVVHELPWLGRRVDLALSTQKGITTAFELKIGGAQRVIEQAAYNRFSFHRSWIVTGTRPRDEGTRWARELGLGVILIQNDAISLLATPQCRDPHPDAVRRLRRAIVIQRIGRCDATV